MQATPASGAQPGDIGVLAFDTVTVATGSPAPPSQVQVQTREANDLINDFDYFLQVTCPNV